VEIRSEDLDRDVADSRRVGRSVCDIHILCKPNRGEMAITQTVKNLVASIVELFSNVHRMKAANLVAIERFEVADGVDTEPWIHVVAVAMGHGQGLKEEQRLFYKVLRACQPDVISLVPSRRDSKRAHTHEGGKRRTAGSSSKGEEDCLSPTKSVS